MTKQHATKENEPYLQLRFSNSQLIKWWKEWGDFVVQVRATIKQTLLVAFWTWSYWMMKIRVYKAQIISAKSHEE